MISSHCVPQFLMCVDMYLCSRSEELNRKENESLKPIVQKLQSAKNAIDAGNAKRGRFGLLGILVPSISKSSCTHA